MKMFQIPHSARSQAAATGPRTIRGKGLGPRLVWPGAPLSMTGPGIRKYCARKRESLGTSYIATPFSHGGQ